MGGCSALQVPGGRAAPPAPPPPAEPGSAHRISHRSPGRLRVKTCTNHHGNLSPFPRERAGTEPPVQGCFPAFLLLLSFFFFFPPPRKAPSRSIIPSPPKIAHRWVLKALSRLGGERKDLSTYREEKIKPEETISFLK